VSAVGGVAHLYDEGYDRSVEVAPGLTMLRYPDGWAIRHACPGVYTEPGDPRFVIAPSCRAHHVVSEDPLTITSSILCLGAGRPCGLHGFVTNGQWVDAGTPPETMAHIQEGVPA
jgi:hypothetical protein